MYQPRPGLLRVSVSAASRVAEGQCISCVPRSVSVMIIMCTGAPHTTGVKMEPMKTDDVIYCEKGGRSPCH